jgi:hypothetical protein
MWAVTLTAFLAASSALALGRGEVDTPQRQRLLRMRVMDVLAENYDKTNWYDVTSDLSAHPLDAENPAVMSIFLSLGNVHLNRFEKDRDPSHLDRSLLFFEWVVANRNLWGEREGSGSVVSYLDISVRRLREECDVGAFGSRVDALVNAATAITAEEADAVLAALGLESFRPIIAGDSSRISLLAAAANFLKDDSRASGWGQSAEKLAASLKTTDCQTLKNAMDLSLGALSYRLARQPVPEEFAQVSFYGQFREPLGCSAIVSGYETNGPVSAVTLGDSLDRAIHDGQVVAIDVEQYLWFFPPGSACGVFDDPERIPIDVNR